LGGPISDCSCATAIAIVQPTKKHVPNIRPDIRFIGNLLCGLKNSAILRAFWFLAMPAGGRVFRDGTLKHRGSYSLPLCHSERVVSGARNLLPIAGPTFRDSMNFLPK
jgi:hypothetical protein